MPDLQSITLFAAIYAVIEVVAMLLAADAIMRARSPNAAIAWSISLVTLPLLVIPLYLIFGRSQFHGYAEAIREKQALVEEPLTEWYRRMAELEAELPPSCKPIGRMVKGLTTIPFTHGNEVSLLVDGAKTYQSMLEAIATAESYILVQFYIVKEGEVSTRLKNALIERAQEGITVCFLYDEIGSWKLSQDYLDDLKKAGVAVSGFKTTQGKQNRFQINFRNHRKLLVVDGKAGFIGGHNLADEYLDYRDTHIRIEGPATQQIQLTFMKDWFWATRQIPETGATIMPSLIGKSAVSIISTGPADIHSDCSVLFLTLINSARERVWITSPYFVPDEVMVRALQAAAIRGVDVRIILPGKADHRIVELASFTYYPRMIECGVKLFRYQKKFLHQKVILIDDQLAGVGTVNLDNRSLYLNFEASALIADQSFVNQIVSMLEADLEESDLVCREQFEEKPIYFRVAARVAALASPLL